MELKIDKTICSNAQKNTGYFQIASGYISETVILFEQEKVIARVQAKGQVTFCDLNGAVLASGEVPASTGGREVYQELSCQIVDSKILLLFPIYQWIDNYPNCDGEHDRWDTKRVGDHTLTFYIAEKTVTVD